MDHNNPQSPEHAQSPPGQTPRDHVADGSRCQSVVMSEEGLQDVAIEYPRCRGSNPPQSRFCFECGTSLRAWCRHCELALPPGSGFCNQCGVSLNGGRANEKIASRTFEGETPRPTSDAPAHSHTRSPAQYTPKHLAERILTSRAALEGQRKQVTVLFADVKGSLELAEQTGPEEWHRILNRFFEVLSEGVHRFEGSINQYTGDGIMALFGAPIAHEDHAQRACYAALYLRDELQRYADELRVSCGLSFFARMGLNSGEVIVGAIGDDLRMDYTAQGHVVGLAQRMEQLAEPGLACLTGDTARLVGGYFQLVPLGPVRVKGGAAPVEVFKLKGLGTLRNRLDVSRARGFTRFIGRDNEMRLLDTALERALGGEAQIVGVVGEAGVGKSRLCAEFTEHCRARGVAVYEAHCVPHGEALPFLPILQLFRSYFGIRENDPPAEARRHIAGMLLLLDERFRAALPLIFDFLGVPDPERPLPHMDPETRRRQLLAFTAEVVRARSAHEPAVARVDDLDWIDRHSDALLGRLIPSSGRTRTLFLLNFRPEYHADWMTRPDYQQVALRPLGPEATADLLRELLGSDPSLAPLTTRLHERAGGNPFFAEELVRSLAEAGTLSGAPGRYALRGDAERVVIPTTVQSLLATRIDLLPENDKEALEVAAVIGKEFGEPLLRAVIAASSRGPAIGAELAQSLDRLLHAELIVERALYPEAEFAFRHPLVQEVAYHSQLAERRARTHAEVAQALEQQYAASLDERAPLLAHHREAAGETLAALRWHARAGAWFATHDLLQSFGHHQRVRALVPHVSESPETLTLGARACASILHTGWRGALPLDEYPAVLAQGRDWAERSGDPGVLARVLDAQATMLAISTGSLAEPRALVEQAMALAERTTDLSLRVSVRQRIGWFLWLTADCDEVLAHLERGIALAGSDVRLSLDAAGWSSLIWMLQFRALTLASLGRLADAAEGLAQAEQLAIEHQDVELIAHTEWLRAVVGLVKGDIDAARTVALRYVEVAERLGTAVWRVLAHGVLAGTLVECGAYGDGLAASERGLLILRNERSGAWIDMEMVLRDTTARALLGAGEVEKARAAAHEVLALCARFPDLRQARLYAHLGVGHVLLRTDGPASPEANDALERAAQLIEDLHFWSLRPRLHLEYAERARLLGDEATRQHELCMAHRFFTEMGATGYAQRLTGVLGIKDEGLGAVA